MELKTENANVRLTVFSELGKPNVWFNATKMRYLPTSSRLIDVYARLMLNGTQPPMPASVWKITV